jgi:hypothetical protein
MSFYHFDTIYDQRNVGYVGPSFSYASMPDQYTLAAFQRNELARRHRSPVMAEIDLVSSHGPWAPLPRMVDWDVVGDGSIFADMPAQGQSPEELVGDPDKTKAAYAQSIQYSMSTLISFVETFGNDDLVVIAVGDHQPAAVVSGRDASRDVLISIITRDAAESAGSRLAHGRVPRPLPDCVRTVLNLAKGGRGTQRGPTLILWPKDTATPAARHF